VTDERGSKAHRTPEQVAELASERKSTFKRERCELLRLRAVALKRANPELTCVDIAERVGMSTTAVRKWLREARLNEIPEAG